MSDDEREMERMRRRLQEMEIENTRLREKQASLEHNISDNEREMEGIRRRLQEVEIEHSRLQETQERQNLGREVIAHLQRGGGSDRVLRALQAVQREYEVLQAAFPSGGGPTIPIDLVEQLKEKLSSAMTHRNVAGAVGIVALGAQIALNVNPVGTAVAGAVALGFNYNAFCKRSDIEQILRDIQVLQKNDAVRFRKLTRAVEALDDAWIANFGYTINSQRFREICNGINEGQGAIQNDAEAIAEILKNRKLCDALKWFAKDVVWKSVKRLLTTHYFYSIINIMAAYKHDPIVEFAVAGLCFACQSFLLVSEIFFTDKQKMAEIDAGLERMRRQSQEIDELMMG